MHSGLDRGRGWEASQVQVMGESPPKKGEHGTRVHAVFSIGEVQEEILSAWSESTVFPWELRLSNKQITRAYI